ncbi:TonB-dependent receptor [Pedobacter sp. SD-b]|uniref:TonB-dependent receptor n=2 Tax=Pedobacter segetis TaxID=2793069 RepID=A0ABS1BGF7_9SPHI|nr:TonB-dependent receptor [Pedobacter segetis]
MKRLSFILLLLITAHLTFAQFPGAGAASVITGKITGTVIDSISRRPVDYATVALSRSGQTKSTSGALADDKGSFRIDNIKPGKYRVTISFIGYKPKTIDPVTTTAAKLDFNLGDIILVPDSKVLGEVTVVGETPVVENKIDRIVYNAEKDVTSAGGNATDVLRKVPLLSVDYDGNVSLRGSSNVKVLINGKPSGVMAGNMADALKAIPADQIKNVEVITSPSAKYDAEGTSGIINIITKKNNLEGVSGSINSSIGTRQNNANLNLNIKKGRFGFSSNAGGYYSWPAESIIDFKSSGAGYSNTQSGNNTTDRLSGNGSVGIDYDFNTYNSVSSTLKFSRFSFGTDGANDAISQVGNNISSYVRNTNNNFSANNYDWNNDFTHKFKKEGQEYSIAAQYTRGNNNNDYTTNFSTDPLNEVATNDGLNQELTFQADYTQPFKKVVWEVGAKSIFRDINSDSRANKINPSNNTYTPIAGRNNVYSYSQDVAAAYSTFAFTLAKKYGFKIGGRYEYTDINGSSAPTLAQTPNFANNYGVFAPSAVISRSFKHFQTVKLSYNKRIQRPSLFYLNPFRNVADSLQQSQGNPTLKPEISHNFEIGYSTFVKTTIINASLFYRRTNGIIESIVTPVMENNRTISLQSYNNIGSNNSFGFNFFGSINPVKPLTLRTNLNINSYNINVDNSSINPNPTQSDKIYLLYNAFVSASVNLPKGFIIESFVILNSPRRTFQGENAGFNMWITGFKKELFEKKGSIGLTLIDPFNERKNFSSELKGATFSQSTNFSIPFRSVGINFSWRFGKLKTGPTKKRGVTNDDLKQGDQNGGATGGGVGGN